MTDISELKAHLSIFDKVSPHVAWDRRKSVPSRGEYWASCPFHDEKSPSFHIIEPEGKFKCFGCGASGDVLDFIAKIENISLGEAIRQSENGSHGIHLPAANDVRERLVNENAAHVQHSPLAGCNVAEDVRVPQFLWRQSKPLAGRCAEAYLTATRKLSPPFPPTLRFLPARNQHTASLISAFGFAYEREPGVLAIDDAAVKAVHLTKLNQDGAKVSGDQAKIIVGRAARGIPIVLAPPGDGLGLAVTEGIEDGLSIAQATGLGVWVAGSASRMAALTESVPAWIDCVTICAHDDAAGLKAADDLVEGLKARGIYAETKVLCA